MKTILVERKQIDLEKYKHRTALETDYSTLLTESAIIADKDTGEILCIYKELDDEELDYKPILGALNNVEFHTGKRSHSGLLSTSRVFGYSPRLTLRRDYCTSTSFARDYPEEHAVVCNYGEKIASIYHESDPEMYKKHADITGEKVLGEYKIPKTPFTSGIVNKDNQLKYHFDTGNFKEVYSAMLVLKRDIAGGHLSIPEFDMGIELKNNSLFMFDGQGLLHGVTPIFKKTARAVRYSIVYYSMRQMWNCLPITDELIRIRKKKAERETKRLERLKQQEQGIKPEL